MERQLNPLWYIPALFLVLGLFYTFNAWWLFFLGLWVVIGLIGAQS